MSLRKRRAMAWLAGLALVVSQAAVAEEKARDGAAVPGVKNVAVVALLPEQLEIMHQGSTVFGNFHYFGDVDWWQINRHASQVLGEHLKQRGRFEVKEIAYDRRAMLRAFLEASSWSRLDALAPHLSRLVSEHGLAGVMLIVPGGQSAQLCRNSGCLSHGNSGFGIYSMDAPLGVRSGRGGDLIYISIGISFLTAQDLRPAASTLAEAIQPVAFKRSQEFIGIPAPALTEYEGMIKNMLNKELPLAVVRMGLLQAPDADASPGDPNAFPSLMVNHDCCPLHTALPGSITQGYLKAAAEAGFRLGDEKAVLTVKKVLLRSGNSFLGKQRGEHRVEGILSYRGNEYFIEESARLMGSIGDVAATVGQLSYEKIRTRLGLPERAPAASSSTPLTTQ